MPQYSFPKDAFFSPQERKKFMRLCAKLNKISTILKSKQKQTKKRKGKKKQIFVTQYIQENCLFYYGKRQMDYRLYSKTLV